MTKKDLLNLYVNINLPEINNLKGVKFAYCLKKNRDLLKPEIEAIEATKESNEDFIKLLKDLEPKRIEIAEKYANKDAKKNPIKITKEVNGQVVEYYDMTPENQLKNNQDWDNFVKAENPKLYKEREKQLEEYQELLKEDVSTMQLHKIKVDELPEEMTGLQVELLKELIRE